VYAGRASARCGNAEPPFIGLILRLFHKVSPRTSVNKGKRRKVRRSKEQPRAKTSPESAEALRVSESKGPSLLRRAEEGAAT
jgi:hypothetical protein